MIEIDTGLLGLDWSLLSLELSQINNVIHQLSRVFFKVAIITLGFQRSDDDTILTEETE